MQRGKAAKYIVRKREHWTGKGQYGPIMKFGKWIKVAECDSHEEAIEARRKIEEVFDRAIYYRGERLDKDRSMNRR